MIDFVELLLVSDCIRVVALLSAADHPSLFLAILVNHGAIETCMVSRRVTCCMVMLAGPFIPAKLAVSNLGHL